MASRPLSPPSTSDAAGDSASVAAGPDVHAGSFFGWLVHAGLSGAGLSVPGRFDLGCSGWVVLSRLFGLGCSELGYSCAGRGVPRRRRRSAVVSGFRPGSLRRPALGRAGPGLGRSGFGPSGSVVPARSSRVWPLGTGRPGLAVPGLAAADWESRLGHPGLGHPGLGHYRLVVLSFRSGLGRPGLERFDLGLLPRWLLLAVFTSDLLASDDR
jgi:hypothetical protein